MSTYVRKGLTQALAAAINDPSFLELLKRPGMLGSFDDVNPVRANVADDGNITVSMYFKNSGGVALNVKVSVPI